MAPHVDGIELVLPRRASFREGLEFLHDKADWVVARHAELPPRVAFADGATVPVQGEPHRIRHRPRGCGGVWIEAGEINVSGDSRHLPRRVLDFLRRAAERELGLKARAFARTLGHELEQITIRDTRSRWGSCSDTGRLTLSWRLILAPERVARYVVAHEIAHLRYMNHGPRFWATVEHLMPGFESARDWLRDNGGLLHRFG
jgi:predicted metal-dependent hydrolase